jgi:hypothetical protein
MVLNYRSAHKYSQDSLPTPTKFNMLNRLDRAWGGVAGAGAARDPELNVSVVPVQYGKDQTLDRILIVLRNIIFFSVLKIQ